MKKKGPLYTIGGKVNLCSQYGKQYGGFSKKLKIELPCDPAIPLLSILSEKKKNENSNSKRHTHPSVHSSIIHSCQDTEVT